jgi:hypothetical protein
MASKFGQRGTVRGLKQWQQGLADRAPSARTLRSNSSWPSS